MVRDNKRQIVLDFIKDFIDKNKYPPVLREISAGCQLSGPSHADYYVQALRDEGKITFEDKSIRTITIVTEDNEHARETE